MIPTVKIAIYGVRNFGWSFRILGRQPSCLVDVAGRASIPGFIVEKSPPNATPMQNNTIGNPIYPAICNPSAYGAAASAKHCGSSRYQTSQEPLEQRIYMKITEWRQEQCTRDVDLRIFYFAAHTNTCFKSGITPPDPCQDLDPCLESRNVVGVSGR